MSDPKRLSNLHQYYPSLFTSGCKAKGPVTGMHKKYNLGLVFILHEDLEPEMSSYSGELTITRVGNVVKHIPELIKFKSSLTNSSVAQIICLVHLKMRTRNAKNLFMQNLEI